MSTVADRHLTTSEFLAAAFGRCESGYFTLFNGATDKSRRFAISGGIDDAAKFVEGKKNIYINVGVLDEPLPTNRRGEKRHVRRVSFLWADLDFDKPATKKKYPTKEHATAVLGDMGLAPSVVVSSGRGLYPLWFLNEPVELPDLDAAIRFEQEFSWPLQEQLRRKLARFDLAYQMDSTHDVARMIRVVGSLHSSGANVEATAPDGQPAYYDRADFEAMVATVTAEHSKPWRGANGHAKVKVCDLLFDANATLPAATIEYLREDHKFYGTWQRDRHDIRDTSASGYSYSLTNIGIKYELTDQQITDMVIQWRREHGELDDTAGEVIRKIRQDIEKVRSEAASKPVADDDANDSREADAEAAAPASEPVDALTSAAMKSRTRQRLLKELRKSLDCREIERVIQYGTENAEFSLVLRIGEGEVIANVGTTEQLLAQTKIRARLAEKIRRLPKKTERKDWAAVVNAILQLAEVKAAPDEAEQLADVIREWISNTLPGAAGRFGIDREYDPHNVVCGITEEEGGKSWPTSRLVAFRASGGRLFIRLTALEEHLHLTRLKLKTDTAVLLQRLQFESVKIRKTVEKKRLESRFWVHFAWF